MKRYLGLLSLILTLLAAANTFSQAAKPAVVNEAAPAFSLTSIKNEKFDLAELRGKVVVLNFWFTGCEPCVAEFPKLNRLVDKFKHKDVVFLAPTWDPAAVLPGFLKEHPFKYHVVPNAGSLIINTYHDGTGNVVFPTHIVIDREGKINTRMTGVKQLDHLSKAIDELAKHDPKKDK